MSDGRQTPLGPIALALSGGGYRAAGFHLGALELLHRVGLLRHVTVLSTVSGGTLTGLAYAMARARGETFDAFFARVYRFLAGTNVIARAVAALGGPPPPTLSGRASLITAAASVYASEGFLGAARLGELMDARTHLREAAFNATELRSGLAFRFHVSRSRALIGNSNVSVPPATARHLRLADIAAASSCFPGAFEPLSFPEDFAWPAEVVAADGRPQGIAVRELPLMDGGIYDNQGAQALLLAAARLRRRGRAPRLFVVSDTRRPKGELFRFPPAAPAGGPTVGRFLQLGALLAAACAVSAVALWIRMARTLVQGTFEWPLSIFSVVLPFALTALVGLGLPLGWFMLRRRVAQALPPDAGPLGRTLRRMPLRGLLDMLELRLRSLLTLTSDVFMERIRSLGYRRLYEQPPQQGRVVASLIYGLEAAAGARELAPSAAQLELVRRAVLTPTRLWVDDEAELRRVVACGQSTLCHELLEVVAGDERLSALRERLQAAWQRLRDDPEALVGDRLGRMA